MRGGSPDLRPRAYAVTVATCVALAAARADAAPPASGPTAAAADDAVARAARQFAEGQKAFLAGDYRRAGDLFEGAYRDKPHHAALWNAARSWQRAGEEVRAANLYARYLNEAPANAPDRDQANIAVKDLASRLARVELHGAEGVTNLRLDGKPVELPVVYVAAGEHLAEADSERGAVRKVVRVETGGIVSVTLAPEPEPARRQPDGATGAPPPARNTGGSGLSPVVFFSGAALSLVGGGLAVASGLDTVDRRDAFLAEPTTENLDRGFDAQTRTNVVIGVSVGIAVVTTVIGVFFTDWKGRATSGTALRTAGPGVAF